MNLIRRLLAFLGLRKQPELTAAQRREQHCAKGIHRPIGGFLWLRTHQPKDDGASLTMSGSHCQDCGVWDCPKD